MNTPPFEHPTEELRQVRRPINYTYRSYDGCPEGVGPLTHHGTIDVVTSIQRKWLVFDQERDYIKVWTQANPAAKKAREEWRDLPSTSLAEIKQDSTS